jgi:hypothetical protein
LLGLTGCQDFRNIEDPLTELIVSVGNLLSAEIYGGVGIKPVEDEVAGQILGVLPAVGQILYLQHIGRGALIVQSIDFTGISPIVKSNPAKIEIVQFNQSAMIILSVILLSADLDSYHDVRITDNVRCIEVDVGV